MVGVVGVVEAVWPLCFQVAQAERPIPASPRYFLEQEAVRQRHQHHKAQQRQQLRRQQHRLRKEEAEEGEPLHRVAD